MSKTTKALLISLIIILILAIDQLFKIWVKTNMTIGESIPVIGNWFFIRFIENPGMAFGIDIPGNLGKPILTIFRIIAAIAIGWYLVSLLKRNTPFGFIICVACIFVGAVGNIIDSMFYGIIFSESSYFETASLFTKDGGYAAFLHGRVVDMLYFPIIEGNYPNWFPFWGGEKFIFFRPIFNIADSAITVGILSIFLFQRKYLKEMK